MIQLLNISKAYGGTPVLDIPAMELEAGLRYAVIGPNGSGKSTLIRLMAGTLPLDGGSIAMPESMKSSIGYLPQQPYAFGVSVLSNTMLAAEGSKQEKHDRAIAALTKVGMEGFASAKGSKLSGGETQRMSLARVLVRSWKLVLLDEPTSATDIAGNNMVEKALTDYWQEHRCTMVFSTHSIAQAGRMADRVILLAHGRVAEYGTAYDVLHKPSSPEAKEFLQFWSLDGVR